jgi:uncharacterized protein (DUF305 family)
VRLSTSRTMPSLLAFALFMAPAMAAQAAGQSGHPPYVPGDAQFMTGMIGHHAQAVLIAGWAPTHGASPSILLLTERIVVGQQDEIALMTRWLVDRGEPVPDPAHAHAGMDHSMYMPGMLSAEQLATLDQARGPEFDRLFLTYMIQHHQGAIVMVDQLFATYGAGQDEATFRLASDIYADQTTEIRRMEKMLAALPTSESSP